MTVAREKGPICLSLGSKEEILQSHTETESGVDV